MSTGRTEEASSQAMVAVLLVLALVLGLVWIRLQPPSPLSAAAPTDEFSAGRAAVLLQEILGDSGPHPVASEAGALVRERLVSALTRLGLEPELQTVFTCGELLSRTCSPVENVVARIPGQESGPAVLLVSHYDSVPAAPGAADDGAAVASMVEIARALLLQGPLRYPVILLINEGEEVGLLGAEAFLEHRWAKEIAVVVNLEARGTTGLSIMFETSDDNAWMIDVFQRAVKRPSASSVSYEVYKRLPNDTDLSVFKSAGYPGMNFAFIEEVAHYHTPLDSLENLDLGSVQHQGECALAVVRALADSDLSAQPPEGNSVYLDLLGFFMMRWPEAWAMVMALFPMVLLLAAGVGVARKERLSASQILWGVVAWLGALVLAAAAGFALTLLLAWLAEVPRPWGAFPAPTRVALWLLTGAAVLLATGAPSRRAGFWGFALGSWLAWSVVGLALAATLPGASSIFVFPALLAASLLAAAAWSRPGWGGAAVTAGSALAGVVFFPLAFLLESSFGLEGSPGVTVPVALVLVSAAPLALGLQSRRLLVGSTFAVGLGLGLLTLLFPAYSEMRPQPLNIVLHQDGDSGGAQWVIGRPSDGVPESVREAAGLGTEPVEEPFPWSRAGSLAYVGEAPVMAVSPPEMLALEEESDREGRKIRAVVRSPRGARSVFLFLPEESSIRSVTISGELAPMSPAGPRYRSVSVQGLPAEGVTVELTLADTEPLEILLADRSDGLPEQGRVVEEARPSWAVPRHHGDVTIVQRRVTL